MPNYAQNPASVSMMKISKNPAVAREVRNCDHWHCLLLGHDIMVKYRNHNVVSRFRTSTLINIVATGPLILVFGQSGLVLFAHGRVSRSARCRLRIVDRRGGSKTHAPALCLEIRCPVGRMKRSTT